LDIGVEGHAAEFERYISHGKIINEYSILNKITDNDIFTIEFI